MMYCWESIPIINLHEPLLIIAENYNIKTHIHVSCANVFCLVASLIHMTCCIKYSCVDDILKAMIHIMRLATTWGQLFKHAYGDVSPKILPNMHAMKHMFYSVNKQPRGIQRRNTCLPTCWTYWQSSMKPFLMKPSWSKFSIYEKKEICARSCLGTTRQSHLSLSQNNNNCSPCITLRENCYGVYGGLRDCVSWLFCLLILFQTTKFPALLHQHKHILSFQLCMFSVMIITWNMVTTRNL